MATLQGYMFDFFRKASAALSFDVWGTPITVQNKSVFSSLFQIDVPNKLWEEASITGDHYGHLGHTHLVSTGVLATSIEGALSLSSGLVNGDGGLLVSKRSPQYQPNRGHKYSSSIFVPEPTNNGFGEWGFVGHDNNVFFRCSGDGADFVMEVCVIRNNVFTHQIDITSKLPSGFDPSKGHLYDIRMQWRGVGDIEFIIDLKSVYTIENLGALTGVSVTNPAMPAGFRCVNAGDEYIIGCGCVDITSEGGGNQRRTPLFVTTGVSYLQTVAGVDTAMIAIRIPRHVDYNGGEIHSARDCAVHSISGFCRDEYSVSVHFSRDTSATNLRDSLGWVDEDDSIIQKMILGTGTAGHAEFVLDKANMKNLATYHNDIDQHTHIRNEAEPNGEFFLTSGDILVLSIKSISGADNSAASITLSEEL